ncbi:retrograde regulation 2 [Lecanosticta acicola]|uniref:Retrograde regulation 2 n=1 Tax=Lecanosticta acicola TaxID=111012 RepID=A0AAI9EDX9_9PEZI|nr:retrograde regulation 2 [Lecanosticta acicola]
MSEKVETLRVDNVRSDKTLRNGVETYGSENAVMSYGQKGLNDASLPDYQDAEVKKIIRKVDWRLPPVLCLLYLVSYLDRSNIGNAKIAGMTHDLHMTGTQYNIALTCFFFPYALFMVPSNMVLKVVKPSLWMAFLMICWGTVMTMHGLVKTWGQLCACRALLGLCETGFFPAASYLLTTWYCRFEYQTRVAWFFSSATLAGAFSGLLAYGIEHMDGVGGEAGWRWIFYVEGSATVVIGCVIYFILPNSPREAKWLTEAEAETIERRLKEDAGTKDGQVDNHDGFQRSSLIQTLGDWKLWVWSIAVCGDSIPNYAFGFMAPTIIKGLGYQTWRAQLLCVPIYVTAFIATIVVALWSDRRQNRWPSVFFPYSVAAIGFVALLAIPHPKLPGLTYAFLFLVPVGLSSGHTGLHAWIANNLAPSWRRAIGMALVPCIGNLGGAIGSNIYLERQAPRYWLGFGFSLGVLIAALFAILFMKQQLERVNRQREKLTPEDVRARYTEEQLLNMGDRSPLYRYVI